MLFHLRIDAIVDAPDLSTAARKLEDYFRKVADRGDGEDPKMPTEAGFIHLEPDPLWMEGDTIEDLREKREKLRAIWDKPNRDH